MADDALIGYLHRHVEDMERHCADLTNQLTANRDAWAAIKAAAEHPEVQITPGFIKSTLSAYGLA